MTLTDLSAVASLVSSLAVVFSLVFLTLQMRQNTKHTRALIQQGRAVQSVDLPLRWAESETLGEIRLRGDSGDKTLTPSEIIRYRLIVVSVLWYFEDQFHHHRDGLIEDNRFAGSANSMERNLTLPGFRAVWKRSQHLFGSAFQAYMNNIMQQAQVSVPIDPAAIWRTDIDVELELANTPDPRHA
jgi:hypothetical protein